MLPKTKRLTTKAFDQYFATGKRIHTPSFQLIYTKGGDFHGAVVVGKKVYKRAVDRNRLRRQLYAVLYRIYKTHTLTGVWIVIAKPGLKNVPHSMVIAALRETIGGVCKKEVE